MTKEKSIIYVAKFVSLLFTPFYLPLFSLIILFTLSYLSMLPVAYRLHIIAIVYFFTIFLPTCLISFYRKHQDWTLIELGHRERRIIPYVISILCYLACVWLLRSMHVFHFVNSIIIAALLVQIVCSMVNVWWKVSTHTAAIGGVAGALLVFAEIFGFNPVWWLCACMVLW